MKTIPSVLPILGGTQIFRGTIGKNGVELTKDKFGMKISITSDGLNWETIGINREILSLLHTCAAVGSYNIDPEEDDYNENAD